MKTTLTLVLSIIAGSANAQNWALLNPAYRYNYSNDGTDTISNQIRVMDVDTLGVDSIAYRLNGVVREAGPDLLCWSSPADYELRAPQFLGSNVIRNDSDWLLLGEDTLLVRPAVPQGGSWSGPGGVVGTVQFAVESDVLGEPDSLKWVIYSNGVALALSKSHGLKWFSRNGFQHQLIGVQGGIDAGLRFPTQRDLFNYQPGDVLEYRGSGSGTDGLCITYINFIARFEVLGRVDSANATHYQVQRILNSSSDRTPLSGSGGSTCDDYQNVFTAVLEFSVSDDAWDNGNPFGTSALNHAWPGAFGAVDENDLSDGSLFPVFASFAWRARKNAQGRNVMETDRFGMQGTWGGEMAPTMVACDDNAGFDWDPMMVRYVEGIGRTYMNFFSFEHDGTDSLHAYSIDGVQVGEFTPLDIVLGERPVTHAALAMDPNPASYLITVSNATPGSELRIMDTGGRLLRVLTIRSGSEIMDVSDFGPGLYFIRQDELPPQRFVIAR